MPITIRNRETEAVIRRLGVRRNEGPSALIKRLADQEEAREIEAEKLAIQKRLAAWDELMALEPTRDPNLTWADLEREMQGLFDYIDHDEQKSP